MGHKVWLFVDSDNHAERIEHIFFTLVASARLHGLDPEAYLRGMIRVVPHQPRGRILELAPLSGSRPVPGSTPVKRESEIGPLTIPAPLPTSAPEEKAGGKKTLKHAS